MSYKCYVMHQFRFTGCLTIKIKEIERNWKLLIYTFICKLLIVNIFKNKIFYILFPFWHSFSNSSFIFLMSIGMATSFGGGIATSLFGIHDTSLLGTKATSFGPIVATSLGPTVATSLDPTGNNTLQWLSLWICFMFYM